MYAITGKELVSHTFHTVKFKYKLLYYNYNMLFNKLQNEIVAKLLWDKRTEHFMTCYYRKIIIFEVVTTSHHAVFDSFLIAAQSVVFYSSIVSYNSRHRDNYPMNSPNICMIQSVKH